MPSTIPYDPSLVLGNIVSKEKLDNIVQISKLQAPADAAESELNSLISLKRSVDMTIQETMGMGITSSSSSCDCAWLRKVNTTRIIAIRALDLIETWNRISFFQCFVPYC